MLARLWPSPAPGAAGREKEIAIKELEVKKYMKGTNEFLDRVYEDEPTWIIQGPVGRRLIIATTEDDALITYRSLYNKWDRREKDTEDS